MKPKLSAKILILLLFIAPYACLAMWSVGPVSKEGAKALGIEIHSKAYGTNAVLVQLEFNAENKLKSFGHVELRVTEGDKPIVTAALREERLSPGHVAVSFTCDVAQLDKIRLWVFVADAMPGGTIYELKPGDFFESQKSR